MGKSDGDGDGDVRSLDDARRKQLLEAAVRATAQEILGMLRQLYPLAPDVKKLERIAIETAHDQVALGQMVDTLEHRSELTHWGVELVRLSLVQPKSAIVEASFVAPKKLEACSNAEQVLKCSTLLAYVSSPITRAVLACNGYRLRFRLGGPPQQGASVIDLDSAREKKDADQ